MQLLNDIFTSSAVWIAALALLNAAVLAFLPTFPNTVLAAINGLVLAIAAVVTAAQVQSTRSDRALAEALKQD